MGNIQIPLIIFVLAFLIRICVILIWPSAFQFDAYQRWAGRDHLFIQVWLPATQFVVWLGAKVGLSMYGLRFVFAAMGSLALSLGGALAQQMAGRRAAWLFLPMVFFGPFLVWSTSPYQESTLLIFLFSGLLITYLKPRVSDWLMGAMALVRYEGWPLIVVHAIIRRSPWAVFSFWGCVLLGFGYGFDLIHPYQASPDSFEDWNDLSGHLKPRLVSFVMYRLAVITEFSGTNWLLIGILLFPFIRNKNSTHWMLLLTALGQICATIGWALSLGVAFSRMMITIALPSAILLVVFVSQRWPNWKRWQRSILVLGVVGWTGWTLRDAYVDYSSYSKGIRFELELINQMERCPDDYWGIDPRVHPGRRARHDGCEVVQGLSEMRAGYDFSCMIWNGPTRPITLRASWSRDERTYKIRRVDGVATGKCGY
jgi:hypothetical protein